MADTPLSLKLQVKQARRLAVLALPAELEAAIGAARAPQADAEVVLVGYRSLAELKAGLPGLLATLRPDVILWLAYPKLTSKLKGDLTRDVIHGLAPSFGLDTVSQIALDADWSAMRQKRV